MPDVEPQADPLVALVSRFYHTIGPTLQYAEGDKYAVSDNALVETLWAIGFVSFERATTAVAGIPGSFTPANTVKPANMAGMQGITASPATPWTVGQYVVLGDNTKAYWKNGAWNVGIAP